MKAGRILKEPLLHFLVAGCLLFVLFAYVDRTALQAPDTIVVDDAVVESLRQQFQRTRMRAPTQAELQGLVDGWVREEVLYREGLAMGLGADDPVIRRRVAQSLEFISELYVDETVTEDELVAWLEAHQERYTKGPLLSFEQIYLNPEAHRESLDATIANALATLEAGDTGFDGDLTMLPGGMADASVAEIARVFGNEFAATVAAVPTGHWTGPVESGYGLHFVRVDAKTDGGLPELVEVRDAVERDLLVARRQAAKAARLQALKSRYTIVLPETLDGGNAASGSE
jgi:hypothetical protein